MRQVLTAIVMMLCASLAARAFEIEESRTFGNETSERSLAIISTTDADVFEPLVLAYLENKPDLRITYVVTNTTDLFEVVANEKAAFDIAISSAMDLQMKLANDGKARAYSSLQTMQLPPWAHWRDQLFAITQEPVVMAVSSNNFDGMGLPRTRAELISLIRENPERFRGKIGTYDPNQSGAGYLFATQDARRSDTFWRLIEVIGGLEPRLYKTTGSMIDDLQSGNLAFAYNVLGSYVSERLDDLPNGQIVELSDFTHILLRTALIPHNARSPGEGQLFLDFLLSNDGQNRLGTQTGLPPIDEDVLARQPHLKPIRLDTGLLVFVDPLKRQKFLTEWNAAAVQD